MISSRTALSLPGKSRHHRKITSGKSCGDEDGMIDRPSEDGQKWNTVRTSSTIRAYVCTYLTVPGIFINYIGSSLYEPVVALAGDFLEWRKNYPCDGDEPGHESSDATHTLSNLSIFVAVTAVVASALS